MTNPMTRRLFIQRLAQGGLAITALGVTAFACGSEGEASSTTAASGDTGSTAGSAVTASTSPPTNTPQTTTTATATTPTTGTVPAVPEGRWSRVPLSTVSAYIVERGGEAAIIDTGVAGSEAVIATGLEALTTSWDDVGHVVLTHLHNDHIGGLPKVLDSAPAAVAYAHEADIPSIPSPRPITAVTAGDVVFGLTVVHTPGHTPGHISLLDTDLDVLFAGDALNGGGSTGVIGPNPAYTPDMATAIESAALLGTFAYETVVFGHGEPLQGGASEAVAVMAAGL